MQAGNATNKI